MSGFTMQDLSGQPDQKSQPTTSPAPTPSATPAPQAPAVPGAFSMNDLGATPDTTVQNPEQQQNKIVQAQQQKQAEDAARKADMAKHGLVHRAWDWLNSPIGDNVLPEGMKTADVIKALAFEKMYGQAYIPGINDFDTKSEEHFTPEKATMGKKTESNGQTHPFVASPETH